MNNPRWFYRLATFLVITLVLTTISVKAVIWLGALSTPKEEENIKLSYPIFIFKDMAREKAKYTSAARQKLFNSINHLLSPALIISFVMVAVKLTRAPDIFEEKAI